MNNFLLNTRINLIFGQAIYISPNLSIDITVADSHSHHGGHNGYGHDCNYGLFSNICIIFDTLWPIMDRIMTMNTTEQNTNSEIERNVDNLSKN